MPSTHITHKTFLEYASIFLKAEEKMKPGQGLERDGEVLSLPK